MNPSNASETLTVEDIRSRFPILDTVVEGRPLAYLDNAASSQKPLQVLEAMERYYTREHSNVHRGTHHLSQVATRRFEESRDRMREFVNAADRAEIIFTRGTTEAINLVAHGMSRGLLKKGDEILITEMEHHSNIVPWQMAAQYTGATLRVAKVNEDGSLDMEDFLSKLSSNTRIVSVVHVSNSLGTVNPVKEITRAAHGVGAWVLLDGAQAAPHAKIDVQDLDCDFYALSGHKMYGPTGSGILYGKAECLNALPPYHGGGEMIETVTFEKTTYNTLPYKFEAGTPDMAGAIGLAASADFMTEMGYDFIEKTESQLLEYATESLETIPGLRIIGTSRPKAAVVSFVVDGTHPTDIGQILEKLGVAVRTGHHCTQPLMAKFDIPGTVRASFAVYNTLAEVDALKLGVEKAVRMLKD